MGFFKEGCIDANEYKVKELYYNVSHLFKGTKAMKVRDKEFFTSIKGTWWYVAAPSTIPKWLKAGERILWNTFNF